MDYEEFCIQSVKLWRGISIGELEKIINEIPLREGVIEVFTYFRKHGYRIACVSSGFDIWKSVFENMHSFVFDDYLANHLVTDSKENLTGEIIVNVTDDTPLKNKAAQLKKLCRKYRLSLEEAIAVGDGLGDIKLFEVAAVSFAVKPTHDEVEQAAHHVLESSNLTEILQYFKNGIYCPKGNRKGI
jgi:phosphoserine phosphatase